MSTHRRTTTQSGVACGRVNWAVDAVTSVPSEVDCNVCINVTLDPITHGLNPESIVPNVPDTTVTANDWGVLREIQEEFEAYLNRIRGSEHEHDIERAQQRAIRMTLVHTFGTVRKFNFDPVFHAQVQLAEQFLDRIISEGKRS